MTSLNRGELLGDSVDGPSVLTALEATDRHQEFLFGATKSPQPDKRASNLGAVSLESEVEAAPQD